MARQLRPEGRDAIMIFVPLGDIRVSTVSVVIPAFNAALTLRETLESLANQTRMADEVIVIDDGSTDETAEIARSFADRLPGLQVISEGNAGVSRARNKGIAASSGVYVAPLDADDVCHPTYLAKMVRRLDERPEAGFVYCFLRWIDMQSRIYLEPSAHAVEGWAAYQFVARNFVASGSNAVFRRSALDAVGGFSTELRRADDYLMQLAVCWRMPIACVPEYLVGYRDVPRSLSKATSKAMTETEDTLARIIRRDMPDMDWTARRWRTADHEVGRFLALRKAGAVGPGDWLRLARGVVLDPVRWLGAAVHRRRIRRTPPSARSLTGRSFYEVSTADAGNAWSNPPVERRLAQARKLDERRARMRTSARPLT